MNGFGTEGARAVPERAGARPGHRPRHPVAEMLAGGSLLVLLAGLVLNVVWIALLGWGSFRMVHWLFA